MMPKKNQPPIFDYTDYRKFLSDYYDTQKKVNPAFSYRFFLRRVGVSSSGIYKEIVEGKRKLSRYLLQRFAETMKLNKKESAYFENMVFFNDAKSPTEQRIYFERLLSLSSAKSKTLNPDQYEFYQKWYYGAIRELLTFIRFKDNYSILAKSLNPAIRQEQAQKAIALLEKLGLIKMGEDGFYHRMDPVVTTGGQVQSLQIMNFQQEMIDMAKAAYDLHPRNHLNMSTLTLSVSGETVDKIKEELTEARSRILALAQREEKPNRVYELNMQLFPLSKITEGGIG